MGETGSFSAASDLFVLPAAVDEPPENSHTEAVSARDEADHPTQSQDSESASRLESHRLEIRINLDPDDSSLIKILSALNLPAVHRETARLPGVMPPLPEECVRPAEAVRRQGGTIPAKGQKRRSIVSPLALLIAVILGFAIRTQIGGSRLDELPGKAGTSIANLADKIIFAESRGNAQAKNPYSSALGLGQFIETTWLDLVRKHRPDIAQSLRPDEILDLRKDPALSRFLAERYVEANTSILARKGLPVTPGSLYLAHFAGPGGAAAILAAPENADAATVIANVDGRSGLTREKILVGNPFMKNFTARDLKNWADLKMQGLSFASRGDESFTRRD